MLKLAVDTGQKLPVVAQPLCDGDLYGTVFKRVPGVVAQLIDSALVRVNLPPSAKGLVRSIRPVTIDVIVCVTMLDRAADEGNVESDIAGKLLAYPDDRLIRIRLMQVSSDPILLKRCAPRCPEAGGLEDAV